MGVVATTKKVITFLVVRKGDPVSYRTGWHQP